MEKSLANLEKYMYIQVQEAYKTLNRPDEKKRNIPQYTIVKTLKTQTKEQIFKALVEKD